MRVRRSRHTYLALERGQNILSKALRADHEHIAILARLAVGHDELAERKQRLHDSKGYPDNVERSHHGHVFPCVCSKHPCAYPGMDFFQESVRVGAMAHELLITQSSAGCELDRHAAGAPRP